MIEAFTLLDAPVAQGFFPILGLAIAAISTGAQVASGVIQTKQAKKAERAKRGADELASQRERLSAVREARIRRADVASAAEGQGAGSSSGAQGAAASIGTQLASNVGFIASQTQAARTISQATLASNKAGLLGDAGVALGEFGNSFRDFQNRRAQAKAITDKNAATRVNPDGS